MNTTLQDIIKQKKPCYFISPHLDDAALSCGGLLAELSTKTDVTVITVFTTARPSHYTLSAKKALKDSSYATASKLYKARREEDIKAFEDLPITLTHLNEEESLYRLKAHPSDLESLIGQFIPEFVHVYPTYALHIAKGKISSDDQPLIERISDKLKTLIPEGSVVFAPEGIGNHIDHLVVKNSVKNVFEPVLWLDQPYLIREKLLHIPEHFTEFPVNQMEKHKILKAYTSQMPLLFSGQEIPDLREYYRF